MSKWIWLSHVLSNETPVYGNGVKPSIESDKAISQGDSCNTLFLKMSNHSGSHVDVERHFVDGGRTIEDYSPSEWFFNSPLLVDVKPIASNIIGVDEVDKALDGVENDADLIIFRTGMEQYRGEDRFWNEPPGFSPELLSWLKLRFPSFSAVGMDTISISSFKNRPVGRKAHQEFLSNGIRIFEDLALMHIDNPDALRRVMVFPLRVIHGDGAPITMIGEITMP